MLIVSVDGGCPGVKNVEAGVIGATSQQYPLLMASMGVEAVKKFAETGKKPKPTEGLDFFDTGVDARSPTSRSTALTSIDTEEGLEASAGADPRSTDRLIDYADMESGRRGRPRVAIGRCGEEDAA